MQSIGQAERDRRIHGVNTACASFVKTIAQIGDEVDIVSISADHGIDAGAAVQGVITVETHQHVGRTAPGQRIVMLRTGQIFESRYSVGPGAYRILSAGYRPG